MTPKQINAIRRALNFSHSEFARALGYGGKNAIDEVRKLENGARTPHGPAALVLRSLAQAVDTEDDATTADSVARIIPRFLDCTDLEGEEGAEIVMHTRYPRFFAILGPAMTNSLVEQMRKNSVVVLHLPDNVGGDSMSFLFIDTPVGDPSRFMQAAIDLKTSQARRDLSED